jgi:RHS repeat-associated protein
VTSADRNLPQAPSPAPGVLPLGYDAAHQISGSTYDGLGRLTSDFLRKYTWNLASELTGYSGADGSASFGYDAFGLRISATAADGSSQNYVLNYALGMPSIATVQTGGADQRYYVHLPSGALLYAIEAADDSHHYYHFDPSGSTTFLSDDSGHVTDSYGVTPYGETVTAAGSTANPFTWLGRWGVMQEGSTGLYYMRFRYYDSASARFLSRDPIQQLRPHAINPYQYAAANPISNMDPVGLKIGLGDVGSFAGDFYFNNNFEWTNGFGAGVNFWANSVQAAADLSTARADAIAVNASNELFNWYEGYLNGTILEEAAEGEDLVQRAAVTEEEAALLIQRIFGGNPGTGPLRHAKDWDRFFSEAGSLYRKQTWYQGVQQEITTVEEEAAQIAGKASKLKALGTGLAVVGVGLQTGLAVHEDIKNGAGFIVTTTDASATVISNVAVLAAPPVAIVDLATGGTVSGLVHNALVTPNTIASLATRTTSREQAAIKKVYTRFAVGRWLWRAGEWLAGD